jgi:competence protein ComEC
VFLRRLWPLLLVILLAGSWTLWSLLPHFQPNSLEAWVLDVGQGESVLVHEPSGKLLLFDGGPDDSVLSQLGAILPPWDDAIDLVILSHNHDDHIRGLLSVFQRYKVGGVWVSGATDTTAEYRLFTAEIAQYHIPKRLTWFPPASCPPRAPCPPAIPFGQAQLQVYHPLREMLGIDPTDQHDATVSVKVSWHSQSIFLTGDLNEDHETDMLASCQATCTLASTILQVPHHGSATGLLPAFLAAVHPLDAVIPVGLNNKYHHPRPETLAKLTAAHIPIYRTDLQGRIHIILSDHGPPIITAQRA